VSGRTAGVVTMVIAAGMLLAGCVVGLPDPTALPTPTPTRPPATRAAEVPPTEGPPPAPEPIVAVDTVVTHVVVRPEQLELVNSAGAVVEELSYDADAEEFADALENVLGGPPDVEERPGGHEWWPYTTYSWPGVAVRDDHEREGVSSDMNVSVTFTHPVVGNGITVSTVQGFRPGDDARSFSEELGETWHGTGYESFPAETGPDIGPRGYDDWTDSFWEYANANAVAVNQWVGGDDPTVTSVIFAPWNFGIGHV